MSDRNQKLYKWYTGHAGVVSLTTLLEFGFSRSAVYRMVKRGELIVLQPGVFQSTQYPTGELQRQIAVCMRSDKVRIGRLTAARAWKFRSLPKDRLIHVMVPHESRLELRGVVVHRCRRIDAVDTVEWDNGLRVTSPPRTLLDIADQVGDIVATSILEQLVNAGTGVMATHVATLARLGHPQRPGTATMARVIAARPTWSRAVQSDLEARVLAEMRRQKLPDPEVQYSIVIADGRTIRFDFAWPSRRVALEVDHPFWHAGEEQTHGDKWRDRKAAAVGWSTHRVTSLDVEGGLREAIADMRVILERAPIVAA